MNAFLETFFILAQVAVVFSFLVLVVHSKHLHIFLAPINVSTRREPAGIALGRLLPMMSNGKALDFEQADPETDTFGAGKIEDFKWNVILDLATCTECGRCQSQCPAWNTGKPLSPKLVIMDLRDHLFAKAPYLLGSRSVPEDHVPDFHDLGTDSGPAVPESGYERSVAPTRSRPPARWSAPSSRAGSSTPTCCGAAPRVARVWSSAPSTSSTSTTSWTCAATRC